MKEKVYYTELAEKYFDATTTLEEERELREFLSVTTDADFDEVKTVMGFMLVTAKTYGYKKTATARKNRLWLSVAAAVVTALVVIVPFFGSGAGDCVMIASGKTTTNHDEVIDEMDRQMTIMLSTADDNSMEKDMAIIFN